MKKSSFSLQFPDFLEISATIGDFIHAASVWKMKEYQHAAMISAHTQVLKGVYLPIKAIFLAKICP